MAFQPDLAAFGHGAMTQNGLAALGGRPLLIVIGEYSNFPAFDTVHPLAYYEDLGFGQPVAPFSTDDPVNPASLREYFRENSSGRFRFDRLDVVGPIDLGVYENDPGPEERSAGILRRVAETSPELFVSTDADGNMQVGSDELCVLLFENIDALQPANRDNNPIAVTLDTGQTSVTVTVRVHIAGAGPLTPFYQIAHELSHSLGTLDMYNTGQGNRLLTLMSSYPFWSNDQGTVHLDAWHKLALGWAEPQIFKLSSPGTTVVHGGAGGALLLWDDTRQAREYFLVERRGPGVSGDPYDADVAGDGVLIWRVQQDAADRVTHLGAPNLTSGGSGVWSPGQQTPGLQWTSGESTGATIGVAGAPDGAMRVAWGDPVLHVSQSRHHRLFHGGNGTTPVDSGLPLTGIFYGVTTDGNLDWNRYNGHGETVGEPPSQRGWDAATGALIGRGFGPMRHVFGCGDGVIMAVHPNGNLHWYRYTGNGESDVTGTLGWDANSGNVIGNGWADFLLIFVAPRAGHPRSRLQIFGVAPNGDLHWYSYAGNGEDDPSGFEGWHPNSGNRVGRGWQGMRHVHGSSNVFFAIDREGSLRWYSYSGQGEDDPTGALGWHANSSNRIGRGWQGMQQVFGGVTDVGGFAHVVFAVNEAGDLHWYRYTGNGEDDPTGTLGWDPRSGHRIGANW